MKKHCFLQLSVLFSLFLLASESLGQSTFVRDDEGHCEKINVKNSGAFINIQKGSLEYRLCERMFPADATRRSLYDQRFGVPSAFQNYDDFKIDYFEEAIVSHYKSRFDYEKLSVQSYLGIPSSSGNSIFHKSTPGKILVSKNGKHPEVIKNEKSINRHMKIDIEYGFNSLTVIDLSLDYVRTSNDWEMILELNKEASVMWRSILEKSNLHSSYDELNNAYIQGEKLHSNWLERRSINKMIKAYKRQVYDFLSSGSIRYTYGVSMLNSFHPFFTQVLLEMFFSSFNYAKVDGKRKKGHDYEKESLALFVAAFGDQEVIRLVSNDDTQWNTYFANNEVKGSLLSLLSMTATKDCFQLGLKPEISRTLFLGFDPIYYHQTVSKIFTNISGNIAHNCGIGKDEEYGIYYSNLYHSEYKGLNKDMLKLFRKRNEF
ncbi:hypothetical protein HBN50_12555 [Halobacteriovorax sp. GB3]|nr:hypothetical protein [Halobacteriovorax sp. GB3]